MGFVIVVSFHQRWSQNVCDRYVLYPEALKIVATTVIGIIFILRIGAIYSKNQRVMIFVWLLLAAQIAVKIWAFTDGVRLDLPDDTSIFALTLWRTVRMYKMQMNHNRPMSLFRLIIRDGIVYFAIIFAANLGNTLVFLFAPDDLKAINASFSTLITTLMVSHLILNLKSAARKTLPESDRSVFGAHPPNRPKGRGHGAVGLGSATAISVHVETHVDFGGEDQLPKANGDPVNSDILATRNPRNSQGLSPTANGKDAHSLSQTQYELSHLSYSDPRTRPSQDQDHKFAFAL
ncbi:hypothetical protein MD484_g7461, partial [Candolleomyces efflorescens]